MNARRVFKMIPLVAIALLMALAVPGHAEERGVKSKVAPIYPDIARRLHLSGSVTVQVVVDASGAVSNAKAVNGNVLLAPSAEDAVRKWKFDSGSGESKVSVVVEFVSGS